MEKLNGVPPFGKSAFRLQYYSAWNFKIFQLVLFKISFGPLIRTKEKTYLISVLCSPICFCLLVLVLHNRLCPFCEIITSRNHNIMIIDSHLLYYHFSNLLTVLKYISCLLLVFIYANHT